MLKLISNIHYKTVEKINNISNQENKNLNTYCRKIFNNLYKYNKKIIIQIINKNDYNNLLIKYNETKAL